MTDSTKRTRRSQRAVRRAALALDTTTASEARAGLEAAYERVRARVLDRPCRVGVVVVNLAALVRVEIDEGAIVADEAFADVADRMREHSVPGAELVRGVGFELVLLVPVGHDLRLAERTGRAIWDGLLDLAAGRWTPEEVVVAAGIAHDPEFARATVAKVRHEARVVDRSPGFRDVATKGRGDPPDRYGSRPDAPLSESGFSVGYQPVHDVRTGALCGAEVFLARPGSASALVPVGEFLECLAQRSESVAVGRAAIETACEDAAGWPEPAGEPLCVHVDVRPEQLAHAEFAEEVLDILHRTGLAPDRLCLDLGEAALERATDHVWHTLRPLANRGVQLVLDDFGRRGARLDPLLHVPFRQLRIDGSLIALLDSSDATAMHVVASVVDLAASLGVVSVAGQIESVDQLDVLDRLSCSRAQGPLIGDPMWAHEFGEHVVRCIDAGADRAGSEQRIS